MSKTSSNHVLVPEKITTVEQARSLPEIKGTLYETITTTLPDGTIQVEDRVRKLSGRGIDGDEIMLFTDTDGRIMQVVYVESGPAKCEVWL